MSGSVLVLRALGLGDILTAVPALRAIGRAFADRHFVLATPAELTPLLQLAGLRCTVTDCPWLDTPEVGEPVELAVNLHGKGPESHRSLLGTDPAAMIAFRHPGIWDEGPHWDPLEHEMSRWCRLLEESGIPADPGDYRISLPPTPGSDPETTVIHPGAKDPSRRWPADRWAAVARSESAQGRRVLVTGSASERGLAEAVAGAAELPPESVVAGRTRLADLAALLAPSGLLVCGDTGVAHLATALGVPSVLLFGPTDPAVWGPPPDGPHRVIWKGQVGDPHGLSPDPGLLDIDPAEVIDEIEQVRLARV